MQYPLLLLFSQGQKVLFEAYHPKNDDGTSSVSVFEDATVFKVGTSALSLSPRA